MMELAAASLAKKGVNKLGFGSAGLAAAGGATVVGSGMSFITTIPEGSAGLKRHWNTLVTDEDTMVNFLVPRLAGEVFKYGRKGKHFSMPFSESWEIVSLQDETSPLPNFQVKNEQGRMHDVHGRVTWGVISEKDAEGCGIEYPQLLYRAIVRARNFLALEESVTGSVATILAEELEGKPNPSGLKSGDLYEDHLARSTDFGRNLLENYGVEVRQLHLYGKSDFWADVIAHGGGSPNGVGAVAAQHGGLVGIRTDGTSVA